MTQLRNRYFLLSDVLLLAFAAYLSYVLRLDSFRLVGYWPSFAIFTALAVLITPVVFYIAGLYARYWRYASVHELQSLLGAVVISVALVSVLTVFALRELPSNPILPRSIPFIFLLLAIAMTAVPRLLVRFLADYRRSRPRDEGRRTVVMGAGDAGAIVVRELRNNPHAGLDVVGFVDDDARKWQMRIHGLPVLGDRHAIPRIVQEYNIEQVIIAIPTAPGKTIRDIVTICERAEVQTKIVPGIYELLNGSVRVSQLRDVQIEDLLRREPVETDRAAIGQLVRGKRILVTGGGGSIGSELCRQVLQHCPQELVILGHGENSVFAIHNELRQWVEQHGEYTPAGQTAPTLPRLVPVIADIRFAERVQAVMESYRPQIVFHAAAHKHVPLMELNPVEAVTNNVLGTKHLVEAALAVGVEQFVMISTDKAVNPTTIMGASKRIAELLVQRAARQRGTAFVAVRFGNVLGSRGSVIPTFKQQIARGGPVTITHPEMVRYFMTIPEAVQLVLQAAVLGQGGETFVLDMGEPVKILDLAHDLIELSGLEVGRDIEIVLTGLRPGEKLFEELFIPGENYHRTAHQKIFLANSANRSVPLRLDESVQRLYEVALHGERAALVNELQQLVPEFQPTPSTESSTVPVRPVSLKAR